LLYQINDGSEAEIIPGDRVILTDGALGDPFDGKELDVVGTSKQYLIVSLGMRGEAFIGAEFIEKAIRSGYPRIRGD